MPIFVDKFHAENILQQLWQDCENEELCDVVLIAGNEKIRIPAHRNILSAASEYFKGMFQSSMRESTTKEIKMSSVNGAILRSIIEYCYSGRVTITEGNAVELLKLADLLLLRNVLTACGNFLSEQLHPSNCLGLSLFADQYRCEELLKKAKDYSLENFMSVSRTHEFLSLSSEKVAEFLANDNICIPAEENVFEILMTWIQHDQTDRMKYKDQLLKLVRLPLLQPYYLIGHVKLICTSRESHQLYVDALEWHLLPDHKIINTRKSVNSNQFLLCLTRDQTKLQIHYYCSQRRKWMRYLKDLEWRSEFGVAVIHDLFYAVGGSSREHEQLNSVLCIHLKTMTIGQINPMTERRRGCGAAVMNDFLYAVGGLNGRNSMSSVEKWNSKTNTWSEVASMSERRHNFGIAQLDDKLYAIGGYCDHRALSSCENYDLWQKVWRSIAPMNETRCSPEVAVANGLLYVVSTNSNTVECYDPQINKWTMLCSLPPISNKCSKLCSTFCNKVVVHFNDEFYEYNGKTNEWNTQQILNGIRHVVCLIPHSGELSIEKFSEIPNRMEYAADFKRNKTC